jgi:hypothetical protein
MKLLGPKMVQLTTNKVRVIRKRLKEAQDRQKSYADSRRRPLEFHVGDKVFFLRWRIGKASFDLE